MPARSGALLYVLRHPHGLVGTAEDGLVREDGAQYRGAGEQRRQRVGGGGELLLEVVELDVRLFEYSNGGGRE